MSLKPVKKSDLGKTWMNPRKGKRILIQPEYHLIVTEGTKTEPNYFKALQDNIHEKYKNRIRLEIHGEGNNTISLFDRAIQIVRNSGITYKHVWIVYDVDDFPADKIKNTSTSQAVEITISNKKMPKTHFDVLPEDYCLTLLTKDRFEQVGDIAMIPYYHFIFDNSIGVELVKTPVYKNGVKKESSFGNR